MPEIEQNSADALEVNAVVPPEEIPLEETLNEEVPEADNFDVATPDPDEDVPLVDDALELSDDEEAEPEVI